MSDTCLSVLCVYLYLHVWTCVCMCLWALCVHVSLCVLSVYVCMCDSVYVCMCACVIVCMCVWVWYVCTNTRSKEVMNTLQAKSAVHFAVQCELVITLASSDGLLESPVISQDKPLPSDSLQERPMWVEETHAQIHVYTLYTNTCTCKHITDKCTHVVQLTDRHQQFTNTNKARTRRALNYVKSKIFVIGPLAVNVIVQATILTYPSSAKLVSLSLRVIFICPHAHHSVIAD